MKKIAQQETQRAQQAVNLNVMITVVFLLDGNVILSKVSFVNL